MVEGNLDMQEFLKRPHWSPWDFIALLFSGFLVFWLSTPWIFPAQQWIEVEKITVEDATTDSKIPVLVVRDLYRATEFGRYEVMIREAYTGHTECFGRRAVPYSLAALKSGRVIKGKTLRWWAYSDDRDCADWDPKAGEYYSETRHCWKRYWWVREACNPWTLSNIFALTDPEPN